MALAALVIALVTAVGTIGTFLYAKRQTELLQKQLDAEHEPQMQLRGDIRGGGDSGLEHRWELRNIGNGDAIDVKVSFPFDPRHERYDDLYFDVVPARSNVALEPRRTPLPSPSQTLHAVDAGAPYFIAVSWLTRQNVRRSTRLMMTGVS